MVIKQVELQHVCGITSKLPDTGQVEVAFAGKSNVGKSNAGKTYVGKTYAGKSNTIK